MAELLDFIVPTDLINGLAVMAGKGLLIMLFVTLVCVALREAPAMLRHLCWGLGLLAILVLPFLSFVVPEWNVGLLSETTQVVDETVSVEINAVTATQLREPEGITASAGGASVVGSDASEPLFAGWGMAMWIVVLWLLGAAAVLIHMLISSLSVWRIVTKARPVTERGWLDSLEEVGDRLMVRRPVQLLQTGRVSVPVAWGSVRPVILLPESADSWTDERRRCVLAHELAHVKRWDTLTQSAARVACAVHWFNPLAWKAARSMQLEREKACDDCALTAARTRASEYAGHLLDIARRVPGSIAPPAGAIAMARRSQLEGRVLAILDEGRRRTADRLPILSTIVAIVVLVLPIAAMNPFAERPIAEAGAVDLSTAGPGAAIPMPAEPLTPGTMTIDSFAPNKKKPSQKHAAAEVGTPDVVERTFQVSDGGTLVIDADHGNIDLNSGRSGEVHVEVKRRPRGSASLEDYEIRFEQNGNTIRVLGENKVRNSGRDGVNVDFVVTLPRRFNLDVETAGGNIAVDDLDGRAKVNTSGGNLSLGRVAGEVDAHTSGGNISLDGSTGNVVVNTSGGNISLGPVGGTVRATTSGGNISVDEVNGEITAKTSGGQISVRLARQPKADCLLKTSGGGITVYLAEDIAVDLRAETSAGHVNTDVEVTTRGEIRKNRIEGRINGGGPLLDLDTSAGDIHIRRL